jgi:hypothetical protein
VIRWRGNLYRSADGARPRYFELLTESALKPGVIAAVQPFYPFLIDRGRVDEDGVFHKIPRIDDLRLAEIFAREVLSLPVG